ncbi:Protein singed wings 2, partial [Pseudolycoriella hygida]
LFVSAAINIEVPIDHGICENWTEAVEANAGNCSYSLHTLHCFGGMSNIDLHSNSHKFKATQELILCGWPKSNFDAPTILKHFPRLKVLRIEHSNLTHINNDFPELHYLECTDLKYGGRPLLTVMQFKINIKEACYNSTELRNCSCTVSYIRLENDGMSLKPMYSINCSRLNLIRLPSYIPENTTIFHATDNKSINISWTKLGYTRPTLFKKLHALKFVDLRWNRLDHMEGPLILPPKFESLFLAGNPWNCTTNLKWLLNQTKGEHVTDRNILKCTDLKYGGRPLLTVMQFKINIKEACYNSTELRNCSCTVSYIRLENDGMSLKPMYSINCSRLNLIRLPSYIPENTTIFHATDNKITSLEPLKTTYKQVQDIYLDHNDIHSIDILESDRGTDDWLQTFRIFSLKGNRLTKLPVYILDNALESNHHAARLYLSLNPWRCDCIFTLRFQDLLIKFGGIIKDATNVTCKYIEGDDNFGVRVLALKTTDVCKFLEEPKIQPLDLLNGFLGSLIVLVLGKLAYDYYHYRKSGRLPWIVTKLP